MHELAIMENVLEIAVDFAKINHAKEIIRINIELGALSNIIPKWSTLFFKMISADTLAAGATLEFEILPAYIQCRACGSASIMETEPPTFVCKVCGSDQVHLLSGREFQIKSIEII